MLSATLQHGCNSDLLLPHKSAGRAQMRGNMFQTVDISCLFCVENVSLSREGLPGQLNNRFRVFQHKTKGFRVLSFSLRRLSKPKVMFIK